jgi:Pectate lyase superfamily protein
MTDQCPVLFNPNFVWNIPIYGETISNVSYDPTTYVMEVVYTNGSTILIATVGITATNAISISTNPEQVVLNLVATSTRVGFPTNLTAPYVVGSGVYGGILFANPGTWCYSPTSYTYQWLKDGIAIPGATKQFYTIQITDEGSSISVQVAAVNQYGSSPAITTGAVKVAYEPLGIGSTTINGGTNGYILYDNGGVLGNFAVVPIAQGGTGTTSPSLVAGSNVTISGSWPNQTVSATVPANLYYNVVTYGASTGATDNSTAFQAAINAAHAAGGGTVFVPCGRYNFTAQIVVKTNVVLLGDGVANYIFGTPGSLSGGVIMAIKWGNGAGYAGNPTYAAVLLDAGSTINNIAFDYPNQDVTASSPTEYGSTVQIRATSDGNINQSILNCYFLKSYVAIDARGYEGGNYGVIGLNIIGNSGCPIKYGIAVNYLVDWANIDNNHFNAGQMSEGALTSGLVAWTANNGVGAYIGGNDWLTLRNFQVWGYANGVLISATYGYSGSGPYSLEGCAFDACSTGVFLQGTFAESVMISNSRFAAFYNPTTTKGSCVSVGSGVSLAGLQFTGNYTFGPTGTVINLSQATQTIANVIIANNVSTTSASSTTFVNVTSGTDVIVMNNISKNFTTNVNLGTATSTVNSNNLT